MIFRSPRVIKNRSLISFRKLFPGNSSYSIIARDFMRFIKNSGSESYYEILLRETNWDELAHFRILEPHMKIVKIGEKDVD